MSKSAAISGGGSAIALAMTGASGAQYGLRLLEMLVRAGRPVYVMISRAGQIVMGSETDFALPARSGDMERRLTEQFQATPGQIRVFGQEEWTAPVASGSAAAAAMVVCPCSMATVAALAAGTSRTLIERAGDVMLKERRPLILVPRETPLSVIHLENLLRLARAGATVLPANPGFYHRPARVEELIDFLVARILDHLGIEQRLVKRWGEAEPGED